MSDQQSNDEPISITYFVPPTNEPWGDILHPVTIFQLLQAESSEDNPLIMEGKDFAAVKLVAHVIRVEIHSSGASYILEDGTGRIHAFKDFASLNSSFEQYEEVEEEVIDQCKAFEHTFVEVIGLLKKSNLRWKRIKVTSICPVHDYSQVMYHILCVIQSNVFSQQCIQTGDPNENFGSHEDMQVTSMDDGQANPSGSNIQCPIACIPTSHAILSNRFLPQKHWPYATLEPLERVIMKYMHHHKNHHVLMADLAQAIQGSCGCTEDQFNLAVQALLSEAYITSPLDDGYVVVTPRH